MYQSIAERYITASNATSLVVDEDTTRSNVDVLIAAGWSKAPLGFALLRLVSEYDATEKRRVGILQNIAPEKNGGVVNLFAKLRSLESVLYGVEIQAHALGMENTKEKSIAVVLHWLDATCRQCNGRKYKHIPNTTALSAKHCQCCNGSGVVRIPFGEDGRKLATYIDDCLHSARVSIKKRLHRV